MGVERILIINPYGIGDVLFTTPLIANLQSAYPQASIAYLANRRTADFLHHDSGIAKVFVYERDEFVESYRRNPLEFLKKSLALFNALRKEGFDLVFDFSLNSSFGFLTAASGIKRRVGFDFRKRGRFLTDRIPLAGYEGRHVIEYYLDLLRHMDIPVTTTAMRLEVPLEDIQWAGQWLKKHQLPQGKPLIALLPGGGASWGKAAKYKRWPVLKYAHLIDKIIENFDADIILMGDPKEEELCRELAGLTKARVHLAVGETSVLGLAALFKQCRVVIVNDGGPLHIAVASGVRTVSIFGTVDPDVYGPYPLGKHVVVQKQLPCQPCYRRLRMAACGHVSCLGELTVEEVYRKVQDIL